MDTPIGSQIAGYRIESVIGRGGMGVVYLAEHLQLQRKAALKILAPELAQDDRFRTRFLRESQLAASIDHPNVVTVHDAGEAGGLLYIAMRYVEGTDLKTLIQRDGPVDPGRAVAIIEQVAAALDAAHGRGLIHRDVKPANVLLDDAGRAYLTDFGLTRRTSSESGLTRTGQFLGTADYMAPEQIRGDAVDGRADVYALGATFYEALTGEPPFVRDTEMAVLYAHLHDTAPPASERKPGPPPWLDPVLARAMAKDPAERYQTADELARDAKRAIGGMPGLPEAAARSRRFRRLVPLVLAAAAVAAAVIILALRPGSGQGPPSPSPSVPSLAGSPGLLRIDPSSERAVTTTPIHLARTVAVFAGAVWVSTPGGVDKVNPSTNQIVAHFDTDGDFNVLTVAGTELWALSAICQSTRVPPCRNTAYLLDPSTNHARRTFRFKGSAAGDLAVGAGSVWIADPLVAMVIRFDPRTGRVQARIPVENSAGGQSRAHRVLAFAAGDLWVVDGPGNLVQEVDPRTNKVSDEVSVESPTDIVADGNILWVTGGSTGMVTSFNPATGAKLPVRVGSEADAVTVGLGSVWVVDSRAGKVYRIDSSSNKVTAMFPAGSGAGDMAVGEDAVWLTR